MEAKNTLEMVQKYFNIRSDDLGGARDEVSAPNVAKFFAKHVESAPLGGFGEVSFIEGAFALLCFFPLVACSTQIRQHSVGGTGAVRQSHVGITYTCRRNRAECEAIWHTGLWCRKQHAWCLFISVGSGCRNQSVVTHEVSSTEASSSDTQSSSGVALVTRKPPI